ncbi:MAG: DUF1501 domain-containing protein [Pirellulaceae bacterium]|nr:DUF1501 domain-containing protein [Pirellulaceae bacterium]
MDIQQKLQFALHRRTFLEKSSTGMGAFALASLLGCMPSASAHPTSDLATSDLVVPGAMKQLHFAPKAKRIIYLFMSGAPSQLDLYDPKPKLTEMMGQDLPDSVRNGQRITTMTSGQSKLLCVGSPFKFKKYGSAGMELSELLPNLAKVVDECTFVRSLNTDPINHDPAVTFFATGNQQPGRPTMGAWLAYGMGCDNSDLPAFVVLTSGGGGQTLQTRYWGNGFLPAQYGGVQFRNAGDPVLFVSNPPGVSGETRRQLLDSTNELNRLALGNIGDPAIAAQIENYELAFRMQSSVPELTDLSQESAETLALYGATPGKPSFANNCLLARRLAERGVRFIQLCHRDWDHHGGLPGGLPVKCKETDQGAAALVLDLKRRGLLDDTIVVWGGEFGRTAYSQGEIKPDNFGRDHHPRCFSIWMAGGGLKQGYVHGETDEFGYNITRDPVHVHDLHATLLHQLGVDHKKLIYRHEGRDYRLTDVAGNVVHELLS